MKKTLVALAVLAASGASFAQVTLSGNVTMGYVAQTTGGAAGVGGTDAAGFGPDTTAVNFNATEDIGGGYKAAIAMGLDGIHRTSNAAGQNATLTLVTPVGALTLGTTKGGDYLGTGIAAQGGLYNGYDEKVFGARSNRDSIGFSVPVGAFTLGLSYLETANQIGLGAGTVGASAATGQSIVLPSLTYASGALKAQLQYLSYASPETAAFAKNVTRGAVSYDFGGFSLGGGASYTNRTTGGANLANPKVTDYLVSVAAPLGNLTLGANWASRRYDDSESIGAVSGTVTGYQLQASYALSKRTAVQGNYTRWTAGNATYTGIVANQDASNQYSVLLSHSF